MTARRTPGRTALASVSMPCAALLAAGWLIASFGAMAHVRTHQPGASIETPGLTATVTAGVRARDAGQATADPGSASLAQAYPAILQKPTQPARNRVLAQAPAPTASSGGEQPAKVLGVAPGVATTAEVRVAQLADDAGDALPTAPAADASTTDASTAPAAASATGTAVETPARPDRARLITRTGVHDFTVEIADDPLERAQGLMFRKSMPPDHAMLFDFGREGGRSFWMKNTPLPLDIIYIEADGEVVSIAARTTPFSTESIPSGGPARFVLEVNGGVAAAIGLAPGDRLLHQRVED